MIVARKAWVSGRVQGVSYRANTQREAGHLGIAGHARNLPDGRVEVLAEGEEDAVAGLIAWLHRGPFLARVDAVAVEEVAVTGVRGFTTG